MQLISESYDFMLKPNLNNYTLSCYFVYTGGYFVCTCNHQMFKKRHNSNSVNFFTDYSWYWIKNFIYKKLYNECYRSDYFFNFAVAHRCFECDCYVHVPCFLPKPGTEEGFGQPRLCVPSCGMENSNIKIMGTEIRCLKFIFSLKIFNPKKSFFSFLSDHGLTCK